MAEFCAENERIKHDYVDFLRQAKGRDSATVDGVVKALARFEESTGYRPFTRFRREQAIAFKAHFNEQVNKRHGEPLSRSTVLSTMSALKAFFLWLADQKGHRFTWSKSDAEYFNLPSNDVRIAKATRKRPTPTLEQVQEVIMAMPATTDIEKRDRAVVAFTLLTGARDGATISFRLKHVDLQSRQINQDAREVHTKFRKSFPTDFFPVGDAVREIVERWIEHLQSLGFGPDDPLFPAAKAGFDANGEPRLLLDRRHWTQTDTVRKIFRAAFSASGLPYSNPHTIRKTLVALAFRLKLPPEEMRTWSMNLGHERMLTTFLNYGEVPPDRRAEIMRNLSRTPEPGREPDDIVQEFAAFLRQRGR